MPKNVGDIMADKDKKPKKRKPGEETSLEELRKQRVAKRSDLIQQSRNSLTLTQQKCLSYIFSKIKKSDDINCIYRFDAEEFYKLLGLRRQSFSDVRSLLWSISIQQFIIIDPDGTERWVRWFNTVHLKSDNNGKIIDDSGSPSRYVDIRISPDIKEYLFGLDEQNKFFTTYQLQSISLMKHAYSIALFELLKSYANRPYWVFEVGTGSNRDIQMMIAQYTQVSEETTANESGVGRKRRTQAPVKFVPVIPKSWSNWAIFCRDVLNVAQKEINAYTDLIISYKGLKTDLSGKKHRRYCCVMFLISHKNKSEQIQTDEAIEAEYREINKGEKYHQISFDEIEAEFNRKRKEEQMSADRYVQGTITTQNDERLTSDEKKEKEIDSSKYPTAASVFYDEYTIKQTEGLVENAKRHCRPELCSEENIEMWCIDYISYYNDKVQSTREDTRTSCYRRLLDMVRKDYEGYAEKITGYEPNHR